MNAPAYILMHDSKHLKRNDDDATLVPLEEMPRVYGWVGTECHRVPTPVSFKANFEVTRRSDYPCNDVNWPLMSPRMLDVLRETGSFPHRLIPVRFVDRRVQEAAHYRPDNDLRPEVIDDRFAAVQLTEHFDVVEWEKSLFKPSRINPRSGYFQRLVLREPAGGLPPLFRIPSDVSMLLVSARARRALEEAGIVGITFMSIPGAHQGDVAS